MCVCVWVGGWVVVGVRCAKHVLATTHVALQVLAFLRKSWDNYTSQFDFRANGQQAPQSFAQDIIHLCTEAVKVFEAEPMYLNLPSNIFVIGDIHGNYADLQYFMSELLLFGDIEITPYSFLALGDYVDRGEHSVECVALCLALKCLSPHTFNMLRGNHEVLGPFALPSSDLPAS